MTDDFEKRAEDKARRAGESVVDHPWRSFFKALGVVVVIVVVIGAVGGVVGWAAGWFNGAAEVTGFQNTKNQNTAVIGLYKSLEAQAANVCEVGETEAPEGTIITESPSFAYAAKYRETAAIYNRRQQNLFEAGIVGPPSLPDTAPTLKEMMAEICPAEGVGTGK
jgi:hypothetical protein